MTDDEIERIVDYLQGKRPGMVELLRRLARRSPRPTTGLPSPGCSTSLRPNSVSPGCPSGGSAAVSRPACCTPAPREQDRTLPRQLLIGHCDTVWPVGTVSRMPVRIEGDALQGPGVFDMKGGLVDDLRPPGLAGLRLPAAGRECRPDQLGRRGREPNSTPLIRRLARRAARAFVLEPAFGRSGKLKTARKASGGFTITVRGRAAHAGINPEEGASAILEMTHQVQRLFALNSTARGINVNVGTIEGGIRSNVVAPEVRFSVDARVRTSSDAAAVVAAIRGLRPGQPADDDPGRGGNRAAADGAVAARPALWRLASELGQRLGLELDQAEVGGASDGNTTSLYTATLDGLGAVGDGAHADHEHVLISRMVERSALASALAPGPADPRRSGRGRAGTGRGHAPYGATMITIREATGRDVPAIRETFLACYGTYYTDPRYTTNSS